MKRLGAVVAVFFLWAPGIASAQTGDVPVPISVLEGTDLAEFSPTDLSTLFPDPAAAINFRYADDIRGIPTYGRDVAPFAQPDRFGAGVFDPGDVGFGNTIDVIRDGADLLITSSDTPLPHKRMILFFGARDKVTNGADALALTAPNVQVDFAIGFTDSPGWVALDDFPGDTWQGGSLILTTELATGQDPTFQLVDANNGFESIPFDGFFAAGADWIIAGVDLDTVIANGGTGDMVWGFGSHVHDGSYGVCEECQSVITTFPPVPRSVDDLVIFPPPITLVTPPAPTTTTTTVAPTTTTTLPPPTTITSPGDDPATVEDGTGASFPWIPVAIGFGGVIGGGLLVVRRRDDDDPPTSDCEPLFRAWKDYERQRETAEEFLGSAYENFQARKLFLMELTATRDEYIQAQSGPRGGIGGLDMVRLDGQLIQYDGLQELIDQLGDPIAQAQDEVARANEEVEERLATYNAAVEAEDAAKAAYEACIQAAAAAAAPPPSPTDDGGSTPPTTPPTPPSVLTPPVSSEPRENTRCDQEGQPSPVTVPVGPPVRFKLYVDFDVITTIDEASMHGSHEHGAAMAAGLKGAGLTLGTVGNLLSGVSAGTNAASAVSAFQSGQMVKGSLDAVTGTVSGLDGADIIPNIPTSLPEAVASGLAAAANLGGFVAGKVTEWMGDNATVFIRPAYYYQNVTIQPTQIWECQGDMWKCVTRVNVYNVGTLEKDPATDRGPFSLKGDREKYKTQREIGRYSATGRSRITQSVRVLSEWENANPPGDCG